MLRIARESIGNAVQHAAATEIRLELKFSARELALTIRDDGAGFDMAEKQKISGHFGLATMQERAQQIQGSIRISTKPGMGTSIGVKIPRKALKR